MPLRPCLEQLPDGRLCGTLSIGSRCEPHRLARNRPIDAARNRHTQQTRNRPGPRQRGLDAEYQATRAICLARSRICWQCGHDGADQADHVIERRNGGTSDLANLRPVHGTAPCPSCDRRCNQQRGTTSTRTA